MTQRYNIFSQLIPSCDRLPIGNRGQAFCPSNIALCKYWGKRNLDLNLPVNSSLSVSLGNKGAQATITSCEKNHTIIVNNQPKSITSISEYLDAISTITRTQYHLELTINIPIAAGLASSACIFAAIACALNDLHQWRLPTRKLSILARLGSGSAARSITHGFVEWHRGNCTDGMDSFGNPLPDLWPELCIGLLIISDQTKSVGSRAGMQRTVTTSDYYAAWPQKAAIDLTRLKIAIQNRDFELLGQTAESNALAMHATMATAWPPLNYCLPQTLAMIKQVWSLRDSGLAIYFTQDAGPNIKLLFLKPLLNHITNYFPQVDVITPFSENLTNER